MNDLDPEARRVLELARAARTPNAADKARVDRGLMMSIGLAAAGVSALQTSRVASANAKLSSGALAAFKWWIASGTLLAGAVAYLGFSTPAQPARRAQPTTEARPVPAVEPRPEPVVPAPGPIELAPSPDAPASVAVEHRRPSPKPTLAAELELLHRAQTAWRSREAQAALTLLNEHRARYPRSELRFERDALAVLTLCELGRKREASLLAHNVLERAPHSPLRSSLEQSCALK